ncbi:Palmitoyltransferase [Mycena venus]|uniref:Palmitoyltransferase n=1 Tax=Mycena venus TaxID=2733690 RepID=A0A8H6YZ82_9AGAR|nr:Palmitoyltransferase [Mycena venus]
MGARNAAALTTDKMALDKPTFCGTITEARYAARERRECKPQPWVVRKLMVVVTLGIMGYTAYFYAGRFFVRLKDGGRRPAGVGLLIGWAILYLWMLWAYIKVILTPPGNACDYVQKTPQPLLERRQWNQPQDSADSFDSCAAALTDIETGRIGATREVAIPDGLPPVYIPGRNGPTNANTLPPLSSTKRRVIAAYDAKWGRPDTEETVWWAGSVRKGHLQK